MSRRYTAEFKATVAVEAIREERSISEIASGIFHTLQANG